MISRVPSSRWLIASEQNIVVGDHSHGIANDVRLAFGEPEDRVDVQPGVHAGDHGQLPGRRHRQRAAEPGGVTFVVGEVLIGD